MSADALLAIMRSSPNHFVFQEPLFLDLCRSPGMKPWWGALFASLLYSNNQSAAMLMVKAGMIEIDQPIPANLGDAENWLWSTNPEERNESDATLPLHALLMRGEWKMAEIFAQRGADLVKEDGKGMKPIDYLDAYKSIEDNLRAIRNTSDVEISNEWERRLLSVSYADILEEATREVAMKEADPPLRRL